MKVDFGGTGVNTGWRTFNLDNGVAHNAPDVVTDITARANQLGAYLTPGCIEEARCIATLEHLPPIDLLPTLVYWRSFMKSGARLLIVVPDMARIARDWIEGRISTNVFMSMIYGPPDWQAKTPGEAHHWGFDADSLIALLCQAGYHDVRAVEYGDSMFYVDGATVWNLSVEAFA